MLVFSWRRGVRDALLQTIRISTAAFTAIYVAVSIKVNVCIGPRRSYVDAMHTDILAPPGNLHKKTIIRKQKTVIARTTTGKHTSLVYPMLYIPDEPQFVFAIL